ncbi:Alkanesulfonates-binding protein [Rubellimicrobium mesophilum DSM 19309]|uniref:Alkanesulfonates-binding protein n=1 Tax=Rubellimicrobium mesophilum DSM 19309 TaxID=442562 RepID=A0A017HPI1_9RHOB|nr:aliphatic sulfonate ABC transporter substrate-binding protein [Rubellimicrobium mesophilum]EYD76412.1 Alkanesulfonates-binding protein [Rubellimicrobium mesophilum DSM 19309]
MTLTRRAFGLAAAALLGTTALPALAQDAALPDAIRIGSTAPGHLKFILFRNLHLLEKEFEAEGIPVELVTFDGGSEASVALGSGQLDLMYTGNNPALRLAASGADVKAVGLSSWNPLNETVVIARADGDIDSIDDLKGHNVAYLQGTVRHSNFAKALETVGLSTDDVESFNFGIETAGPALARGDIDAIVESRSTVQTLIDQGLAKVIFDGAEHPEWVSPYPITVNGEFARRYPEVLARILAVDIQTAAWADAHPDETIRIFAEETGRPEDAIRATYPDNQFHQSPEITQAAIDSLRDEESFMAANGLIEGQVDYDAWIDTSYYQAALGLLQARTN